MEVIDQTSRYIWAMVLMGAKETANWKLHDVESNNNGLSFRVQGSKYVGRIYILGDPNSRRIGFDIKFVSDNNPNESVLLTTLTKSDLLYPKEKKGTSSIPHEAIEHFKKEYGFSE